MKEFEGCDKCQHKGKGLTEYPCNTCVHNAIDHYKPMTNADYIRSMTDEELSGFIKSVHDDGTCKEYAVANRLAFTDMFGNNGVMNWLKAEREGQDD